MKVEKPQLHLTNLFLKYIILRDLVYDSLLHQASLRHSRTKFSDTGKSLLKDQVTWLKIISIFKLIKICGFKFSEDPSSIQRTQTVILVWIVFISGHSEGGEALCEEENSCMLP